MEPLTPTQMAQLLAAAKAKNPGDPSITMAWLKSQPPEHLQASWQRMQGYAPVPPAPSPEQGGVAGGLGDALSFLKGIGKMAGAAGNPIGSMTAGADPDVQKILGMPGAIGRGLVGSGLQPTASDTPAMAPSSQGGIGYLQGKGLDPSAMGQAAPQSQSDFLRAAGQTAGGGVMAAAPGLGALAGIPTFLGGAAMTNPSDPTRAMTSAGLLGAAPWLGGKTLGAASDFVSPEASAMRQVQRAAGGVDPAAMMAQRNLYTSTGREGMATPADLIPGASGQAGPLQQLLMKAASRDPALAAKLRTIAEERSAPIANQRMMGDVEKVIGDPSSAGIEAGLAQARGEWSGPVFKAVRDNSQPMSFGKAKPLTIRDAMGGSADPAAVSALQQAIRTNRGFNQWWEPKVKNSSFTQADYGRTIPGTEPPPNPVTAIFRDPEVIKNVSKGVTEKIANGQDVPFADLMDAYQDIDWATNHAFKSGDRALGFRLAEHRTALGDAMATHESAWGEANMGFRRLARQQEAFQRGVDAMKKGQPNDIQDARQLAVNAENPAAFTRGLQSVLYEKLSKSGNVAEALRPAAVSKQGLLPAAIPDDPLQQLLGAGRAERAMAPLGSPSSTSGGEMGMPYPTANPTILAMKAALKFGVPAMRRSTAASIGDLLAGSGPQSLDALLAQLNKK